MRIQIQPLWLSVLTKTTILAAGVLGIGLIEWPVADQQGQAERQSIQPDKLRASKLSNDFKPEDHFGVLQVDLNKGSKDDFERLPGIGPILAQRMIDYRDSPWILSRCGGIKDGIRDRQGKDGSSTFVGHRSAK